MSLMFNAQARHTKATSGRFAEQPHAPDLQIGKMQE